MSAPGWRAAVWLVLAVTAARVVALAFNRTDLFVDESQYWLWGQRLDLGYYSKPPLIAWVISATTGLAGSDAPFWVRLPGPFLHGVTALVLGAAAGRLWGARAAFWTAATYVTLPLAAVGSLLFSTDTVMAPFYAVALYGWLRLAEGRRAGWAAVVGVAIGLGFLAKYAAVHFLLGAALAAVAVPSARIGWGNALWLLLAFGAVISPNVVWNLTHELATVSHTLDNVGWMRGGQAGALNPAGLAEFFLSQFAVFGPVLFAALLWAPAPAWRGSGTGRALLMFALPVVLIVCAQALLDKAYANWAVAGYFAGTILTVGYLLDRAPRLLPLSLAVNGTLCLILALATVTAPWPEWKGAPLMKRYLGRADLSRQILDAAVAHGATAVFAAERDLLADLFYTGAGRGIAVYAPRPSGRPRNYYEQTFPLPENAGRVLFVLSRPPRCDGTPLAQVTEFATDGGVHAGRAIGAYLIPEDCRDAAF